MAIVDAAGMPIAIHIESASPEEATLVEDTIESSFISEFPQRLVGNKAHDSDKLDAQLKDKYGIELIAPNRRNRGKTQDGRQLRRYR